MLISFTVFCNFINFICCWLYSCHDLKLELFWFIYFIINLQLNILIQFNYVKFKINYVKKTNLHLV